MSAAESEKPISLLSKYRRRHIGNYRFHQRASRSHAVVQVFAVFGSGKVVPGEQ